MNPVTEAAARNVSISDIGAESHTRGSVHLDERWTEAYEDAGSVGDATRRSIHALVRSLCERDDVKSIEIYADGGYVLEQITLDE